MTASRLIDRLANAIACQEGWFDPKDKGLNEAGIVLLYHDLWAKVAAGMTLRQLVEVWAPPNENNTAVYLQNVQKWTGVLGYAAVDVPLVTMIEPLQDPRV